MIFKVSCLAALCLSLASPIVAQDVAGDAMSPQQFFDVGVTMMRAGKPQDAANVADALLNRDPNDASALILRAEAAIDLRDYAGAVKFARAAYNAADIRNQKFAAARLVALAHSQTKNDTFAQLWLRRARQFAPDAIAARGIAEDYQFLRNRNPWSTQLRFGITPSNNVNNGSAKSSTKLFGLPFEFELDGEARALSGLEISGGFDTRYRLSQSRNAITYLTLSADARTYVLSAAAQKQAPDARGNTYGDASLRFGVNHRRIISDGAQPTDFSLTFGQTWLNGDDFDNILADSHYVQGRVTHSWVLGERDSIMASVSVKKEIYMDGDPAARTNTIFARWAHTFDNKDAFSLGVNMSRRTSQDITVSYDSKVYSIGYDLAKPVAGMRLGFGMDFEQRDFEASIYAPGPREDRSVGLNMSVELTNVEYYGFRPVMNVELRRNDSSIDLFDRDYTNVGFDLRSSF